MKFYLVLHALLLSFIEQALDRFARLDNSSTKLLLDTPITFPGPNEHWTSHPRVVNNDQSCPTKIAKVYSSDIKLELFKAVIKGDTVLVNNTLQSYGSDAGKDDHGYEPIHYAAAYGFVDILDLLYESCADINAQTTEGRTALHFSVMLNKYDVTEQLLKLDVIVNTQDKLGFTALHYAAYGNFPALAKILLDHGASSTIKCYEKGTTPYDFVLNPSDDRDRRELIEVFASAQRKYDEQSLVLPYPKMI